MNMDRKRPPEGCDDLALWLSETINDAIRDCRDRGLKPTAIALLLLHYARQIGQAAMMSREVWESTSAWWGGRPSRAANEEPKEQDLIQGAVDRGWPLVKR